MCAKFELNLYEDAVFCITSLWFINSHVHQYRFFSTESNSDSTGPQSMMFISVLIGQLLQAHSQEPRRQSSNPITSDATYGRVQSTVCVG